jgi:CrcB protein
VIAVAIAAAGFLGAVVRYLVDDVLQDRAGPVLPAGTIVVNVTGSLVAGFAAGLALYHGLGTDAHRVVATGFLGAYTTFSTYALDARRLAEAHSRPLAVLNLVGSVAAGLAAAAAGLVLAAAL